MKKNGDYKKSEKGKDSSLRRLKKNTKHKTDKPLVRLIKKEREKNQFNKLEIKMEKSQETTQK